MVRATLASSTIEPLRDDTQMSTTGPSGPWCALAGIGHSPHQGPIAQNDGTHHRCPYQWSTPPGPSDDSIHDIERTCVLPVRPWQCTPGSTVVP
ncbi:hypothetical protein GOBAR_AA32466 [Gossypium barbadense]|uniref:Uncharacterized protein n=1 Tax=Gossypium barbadense TaxID=3634 RepID=A0A2P5WAW2_GOSBA|nr:hypothetical protein GOBAR_AA32466 [Gossypium barbadense]